TRAAFQAMPLGPEAVTAELGPTTERFGRTIVHVPVAGLDEVAAAVRAALPGDEARPFRGHTVEPFRGHAVQPLQGHAARPFRGHLTLARARSRRGVDLYEVVGLPFTASFLVSEITLVSSVLGHGPPKYEVVARRAL
ncbi:MAG: hypothetical protein QOI20_2035, partial [Acidimicrobiaceae bacterium]|nr:hypothetical protein [Acidimicrobiaceae bacterium]